MGERGGKGEGWKRGDDGRKRKLLLRDGKREREG